ncbi:MAG: 50S ribosomal protein L3, partial [Bifidobacteriaceae bacterium]|nr:50S ribosomal protein L3 [Bifidobacteriaceae bacterium]
MTTAASATRPITALLGTKVGMTQAWDDQGRVVPLTVVRVGTTVITQVRTAARDAYSAIQLAYGEIDPRKV